MMKRKPNLAVLVTAVMLLLTAVTSTAIGRDPAEKRAVNEANQILTSDLQGLSKHLSPKSSPVDFLRQKMSEMRVVSYDPPYGYEQVGTTDIYAGQSVADWFGRTDKSLDLYGRFGDYYHGSSYEDGGIVTAIQFIIGDESIGYAYQPYNQQMNWVYNDNTPLASVYQYVEQQGEFARIVYQLTNNNESELTLNMGVHWDLFVGDDDNALVSAKRDSDGNPYGISLKDASNAEICVLFGDGLAGVTPVSDYWFGFFCTNYWADAIVGNYDPYYDPWEIYSAADREAIASLYMLEDGGYDSGAGFCWRNINLPSGQTREISYLVGLGEVNLQPDVEYAVTPDDRESWNDLSILHKLNFEGIYFSPAGLDGHIEYAFESKTSWNRLTEDIPSGQNFTGELIGMFNPDLSEHTIYLRTVDNVGNTNELEPIIYKDVAFSRLDGITDLEWNFGEELTQSHLSCSLPEDEFAIGNYRNNVDHGIAYFDIQGVFPYSIGKKTYSFEIKPFDISKVDVYFFSDYNVVSQQLGGDYALRPSCPVWDFTDWRLQESRYYFWVNADWADNFLPGTGTLTVTGHDGFCGSIVKKFEIQKGDSADLLYHLGMCATTPSVDVTYDGRPHGVSWVDDDLAKANEQGAGVTLYYTNAEGKVQLESPVQPGKYKAYLTTIDSEIYEECELMIHEFEIYKLDMMENAALIGIAQKIKESGAELPWNPLDLADIVNSPRLDIQKGHVTGVNLSDMELYKLGNQFVPVLGAALAFSQLEHLSIAGNSLVGDLTELGQAIMAGLGAPAKNARSNEFMKAPDLSSLKVLDISDNQFSGNVGVLGIAFPGLTTLKANDNCISDVVPALPESVTECDLSRQKIDRVMDLDLRNLEAAALVAQFPTVLFYDNDTHSYRTYVRLYITDHDTSDWSVTLDFNQSRGENALMIFNNAYNQPYTGENGATLTVLSLDYQSWGLDGTEFAAKFSFAEGDANFDGSFSLLDLQSTLLWMFGEYFGEYPFNFTAADTYTDSRINVQDIVVDVNMLLAQTLDNQGQEWRVPALGAEVDARIWTEDGTVWLESQTPVAAIQLNHDGEIEWTLAELGMSVSTADGAMVAWSPTLSEIPAGRHAIGRVSSAVGRIAARCADRQARALRTAASTDLTTGAEASAADRDVRHIGLDGLQGDDSEVIINITRDGVTKQINTNRNKR